jgi:hypothetical protein
MENTSNLELLAVHRIVSEYAERIYVYMEMTQRDSWRNRRIRKETLGVIGEYAKRHKSLYISVNNNKKFKFLTILFIYTISNGLSQKAIPRYCPFKENNSPYA